MNSKLKWNCTLDNILVADEYNIIKVEQGYRLFTSCIKRQYYDNKKNRLIDIPNYDYLIGIFSTLEDAKNVAESDFEESSWI